MKKNLKPFKAIIAFIFLSLSFIGCDKDFTTIGTDVIGNENFQTNSFSYPVITYNQRLNPVQTNNLSSNLLGVYNDPVYGITSSSFVSQMTLADRTYGENIQLDSVVLTIPYFSHIDPDDQTDEDGNTKYVLDSVYGNTDAPMKFSVFRNNYYLRDFDPESDFEDNQKYYSDGSTSVGNSIAQSDLEFESILVEENFFIESNEIILKELNSEGEFEETARTKPSLRIVVKLPEEMEFWQETIIDKMDDQELSNANNFEDYFRGLYFKLEQSIGDSSMIMLDVSSTLANVSMHYTSINAFEDEDNDGIPDYVDSDIGNDGTTDEGKTDTDGDGLTDEADLDQTFGLDINNDGFDDEAVSVNKNTAKLNFSGNKVNFYDNDFNIVLEDGDVINGDEKLYLKGGEGSMAIINLFGGEDTAEFTEFKSHQDEWIINEAQLVFYEDETTINTDDHDSDRLYVYDVKNNIYLIDFQQDLISTSTPLNSAIRHLGRRFEDEDGNKKFKIRITEHINKIFLSDSTNTKLGLVLSTNVNSTDNSDILGTTDQDDLNKVPSGAVLSPKGTILYGNNSADTNKKVRLEIFYTEPN